MNKSSTLLRARVVAAPLGLVIAVAAVASLAACGSSSSNAAAPPSTSSATSSSSAAASATSSSSASGSATSAPAYKPLTKAQLAALLPSKPAAAGWKSSPSTDTSDDADSKAQDAELSACTGDPSNDEDRVAQASTPDFTLETSTAVQDISAEASSYKTVAEVTTDVKTFKNPKLESCFQKQLQTHGASLFGDDLTYVSSTVKVTPSSSLPVVGRIDAILQLKTKAGKPVTVGVTEVALIGRGVEESLTFIAIGQAVSAAVAQPFITEAAAKLAKGTSTTDA